MNTEYVTINVRIKGMRDGSLVELPWAEPIFATEFGGDYRLHTDMFFAPLWRGDVVRCEVTPKGELQAVDIRHILPGLLIGFEHPRDTDATVKRILRAVRSMGYQVVRPADGCVLVFVPGGELDRDIPFPRLPDSWNKRELLDGPFRMRAVLEQIDFSLATDESEDPDRLEHPAPDDPSWVRLDPQLAHPSV